MQYVAKINCDFNIISMAQVGRSENIVTYYHIFFYKSDALQNIVINK